MRTIESIVLALVFLAFNIIVLLPQIIPFGIIAQLLWLWLVGGVLTFCGYYIREERKKEKDKEDKEDCVSDNDAYFQQSYSSCDRG